MDWNSFFHEHGPALLLYARQWVESCADAEEAVQDGMLRFWRAGDRYGSAPPVALLYTMVKRAAQDLRRSGARRAAREHRAWLEQAAEPGWFLPSSADGQEEGRRIEAALRALPDEQRETVVLKVWGGLTFREVAEVMSVPPDTAASRYRYAVGTLRKVLGHGQPVR